MEFDATWMLLGLPLAFVLGWLASRFDLRQLRAENRRAPKAYFKGLNFLLNEQQDQAIDAFIEAVEEDDERGVGSGIRRAGCRRVPVEVDEVAVRRFPAFAQVGVGLRLDEQRIDRLCVPAGQPFGRPIAGRRGDQCKVRPLLDAPSLRVAS